MQALTFSTWTKTVKFIDPYRLKDSPDSQLRFTLEEEQAANSLDLTVRAIKSKACSVTQDTQRLNQSRKIEAVVVECQVLVTCTLPV